MKIIEYKHGVIIVETAYSKVMLRFIWNKDKGTKYVNCFQKIDCMESKMVLIDFPHQLSVVNN